MTLKHFKATFETWSLTGKPVLKPNPLVSYGVVLLFAGILRWRTEEQRLPSTWPSKEMCWWWSTTPGPRWEGVCRPRSQWAPLPRTFFFLSPHDDAHYTCSSLKHPGVEFPKNVVIHQTLISLLLPFQMASMKMFQIQFHTGFVPRNATTVKFAK